MLHFLNESFQMAEVLVDRFAELVDFLHGFAPPLVVLHWEALLKLDFLLILQNLNLFLLSFLRAVENIEVVVTSIFIRRLVVKDVLGDRLQEDLVAATTSGHKASLLEGQVLLFNLLELLLLLKALFLQLSF